MICFLGIRELESPKFLSWGFHGTDLPDFTSLLLSPLHSSHVLKLPCLRAFEHAVPFAKDTLLPMMCLFPHFIQVSAQMSPPQRLFPDHLV